MNKVEAILTSLKHIDAYIDSLIRRRDKIEASLLSTAKWSADKVKGGVQRKQDDIYVELITVKDDIEKKSVEAIRLRAELESYIDAVADYQSRNLLSMLYIEHIDRYDICEQEQYDMSTFYRKLAKAKQLLANECE
ncbi:DUF1492 domain-containing protein [Streptococcus intermedius]